MADTSVEGNVLGATGNLGIFGPYWDGTLKGVIVFIDGEDDISFAYTDDGGATWATTQIEVGTTEDVACWYDKETPGDAGTLVHVVWLDSAGGAASSDCFYITIDVNDASQGTKRTIDAGLTVGTDALNNRISITKTVSGYLLMALSTQTEIECYRSVDAGVNWTDRADPFETAQQEDWLLLFPAETADDNDAVGIFWDRNVGEVSIKMYDDSGNTWTETAIGSAVADGGFINIDGAVRQSDGHIILAYYTQIDTATTDLLTWDLTVDSIAAPTVTSKPNIFTDQAESAQVAVFINQQNDFVYIAYLKGGTWKATVDVVYHLSDDNLVTWEAESAYSEAAADDIKFVHGGRSVGDAGGRLQFSFFNHDLTEIFVNLVNDISIAAVGVGVTLSERHFPRGNMRGEMRGVI